MNEKLKQYYTKFMSYRCRKCGYVTTALLSIENHIKEHLKEGNKGIPKWYNLQEYECDFSPKTDATGKRGENE